MPGPLPKPSSSRQRRNKSASKATLTLAIKHDVPELPEPQEWIGCPFSSDSDFYYEPEWSEPVRQWWEDIWTSPMSNEFHESDVHGLYQAAMYLHESRNPMLKPAERLGFGRAYEAAVKNFGLTPMSRRTLQWEIARADEATDKNESRKEAKGKIGGEPDLDEPKTEGGKRFDPRVVV